MIFCLLQVILVKVGATVDTQVGENIVQLIIIIFQSLKRVTENGLIAYGGLCAGLKDRVNVKDFGTYLLWALDGDDEGDGLVVSHLRQGVEVVTDAHLITPLIGLGSSG